MVNKQEDCGCGSPANLSTNQFEVLAVPCTQCTGPDLFLTDDHYCIHIERDITQGPNTIHQNLYYGIGLINVLPNPVLGLTLVNYRLCFCQAENGDDQQAGVSHITFELCPDGPIPVAATVNGEEAVVVEGDPNFFEFPSFKIESGNFPSEEGTCVTITLVYEELFDAEDLSTNLQFGVKIGGGNDPAITTGRVTGLPIFCSTNGPEPTPCEETDIYVEACVSADVTVTGSAEVGEVEVHCLGPVSVRPCALIPGPSTFTVYQRVCVKIPIKFTVDAEANNETVTTGQPSETSCIPTPPPTNS